MLSVVNEPLSEYVSAQLPGQVHVALKLRDALVQAPVMMQQPFMAGWTLIEEPPTMKVNMLTLMLTRPNAQV